MESIFLEKEDQNLVDISASIDPASIENKEEKVAETKHMNEAIWKEWKELTNDDGFALQVHEMIEEKVNKGLLLTDSPEYIQNKEFINEVSTKAKSIRRAYTELTSHKGWTTQVDNHKGVSVYYRKEENTPVHTFKAKFRCQCDILSFVATINEFDLVQDIISIPAASIETRYLKEISDVSKVCYCKINLCWPLTSRDCIAKVFAYNCLDRYGAIVLTGESVNSESDANQLGIELPSITDRTARIDLKLAYGMIAPVELASTKSGKDCVEIISVFNIDFRTAFPQNLINWVTRTFGYYFIVSVRNLCENLKCSEVHMSRMSTNPVYAKYRKRLEEWKESQQDKKKELVSENKHVPEADIDTSDIDFDPTP